MIETDKIYNMDCLEGNEPYAGREASMPSSPTCLTVY